MTSRTNLMNEMTDSICHVTVIERVCKQGNGLMISHIQFNSNSKLR
jgi:hypothetical protein